tara:strand:+ start:362 stop:622 length:261 start_codon:yes stop_codon:yes gene_type:complete
MLLIVKYAHVTCVTVSGALFAWRGLRLILLERRPAGWERVVPHVIDTLLLASALTLLVMLRLNPFDHAWLIAKLCALSSTLGSASS